MKCSIALQYMLHHDVRPQSPFKPELLLNKTHSSMDYH